MTTEMFITAVGRDRPGVVAAITGSLAELDANLEDTSMTILGGRFAMVLLVVVPDEVDATAIDDALAEPARSLHLDVSVHRAESSVAGDDDRSERWTLSIYGVDHPGIVHGVAAALADLDVNILDMRTRVVGPEDRPVYVMALDVLVPPGGGALGERLEAVAAELGVECSLHPVETDIL
jgi:glycine cleavage system transcriptional repressor